MSEEATNHEPRATSHEVEDDEISLLDLAIVLAKHKKLILVFPAVVGLIAVVVTLLMTPIYTGTTKILPPQQSQSTASALLAQLDNLPGLTAGIPGLKNPNDLYIGMLKSRTVADNLIQRFDLSKLYERKYQSDTRKMLEGATKITAGKDGIIVIEVDDRDPKRAAALANAYVEELLKLTNILAVTAASQRRLFLERQFAHVKESLGKAEVAAREALERGGLANVDAQSRGILETTARLRAQISVKEIEVSAMRTFAADQNPDLVRGQRELVAMKQELAKIEGATEVTGKGRGVGASGLENVRLLREVRYNEILYELLAKQYELARIDEANDGGIIQVLDKAIEPDRKSKPKRALIVLLSAFAAGLLALIWVFALEALEATSRSPAGSERLGVLKRHLRFSRH